MLKDRDFEEVIDDYAYLKTRWVPLQSPKSSKHRLVNAKKVTFPNYIKTISSHNHENKESDVFFKICFLMHKYSQMF